MSLFSKIVSVVLGPAAGVASGVLVDKQKPIEAVKEAVAAPVTVPAAAASAAATAVANVHSKLTALEAEVLRVVGGQKTKSLFLDIRRIMAGPTGPQEAANYVAAVDQFVQTGDLSYLDPIIAAFAAEIKQVRENYWAQASAIPREVVAAMPTEVRGVADQGRWILVEDVNSISAPSIAIDHLDKALGFVALDLLIVKRRVGAGTISERHFWAHELFHMKQYQTMGLVPFAKRYWHHSISGSGVNPIEEEADRFACAHFPSQPAYISKCPGS